MSRKVKYIYSDYLIQQADKNPAVKNRASLTHNLIQSYGLLNKLERIRPISCNTTDLKGFHTNEYIEQLKNYELKANKEAAFVEAQRTVSDDDEEEDDLDVTSTAEMHGLSYDCPAWRHIKEYVCCIAGATMTSCQILAKSKEKSDIVINWCGGWHHAEKNKAAGFCYVNDIVLGILVLSVRFKRILYIDLDNHHGDGVEHAFTATQRVFCLSFHQKECGYYPGTGDAQDWGRDKGLGFTANFPYKRGITGENYIKYFKRISSLIISFYKPEVCVIQCGADVIVGDPLGGSNLIPEDLIECVKFILNYDKPCVLLGGGGYNFSNAARFWCCLTAAICGQELCEDIPADNEDFLAYGPDYSVKISREKFIKDFNTQEYLEQQAGIIEDNLNFIRN